MHDHPLLNSTQYASIEIALRETEIVLRHMLDDMDSHEEGILYAQIVTLTDEQRQLIVTLTSALLDEIAKLAEVLAFSKQRRDPVSSLVSQITVLWSDLVDVRADKLSRYGNVNSEAAQVLNPSLDRMIRLMEDLIRVLSNRF
ncbi:MAG: hypothetical protein ACFLMY_01080 [Candidatus Brachytrichaceae bacterium NZ_4S206]|jgi:hypothetical protein